MKRTLFLTGFVLVAQCQCQEDDSNVVSLNETGWIKGELRQNILNKSSKYFAFHGIPYAEPPIEDLRFQLPVPYSQSKYGSKSDPYDASDAYVPHVCPQNKDNSSIYVGSINEDCLHLSIYTPKINPSSTNGSLFPVLVWIHGGHFISGSGMHQYYGPERFMKDNDIVMVSINYRLGTLGFLSLGTSELPGNAGLDNKV